MNTLNICLNFLDKAWWLLLRIFGLLTSSLLLRDKYNLGTIDLKGSVKILQYVKQKQKKKTRERGIRFLVPKIQSELPVKDTWCSGSGVWLRHSFEGSHLEVSGSIPTSGKKKFEG